MLSILNRHNGSTRASSAPLSQLRSKSAQRPCNNFFQSHTNNREKQPPTSKKPESAPPQVKITFKQPKSDPPPARFAFKRPAYTRSEKEILREEGEKIIKRELELRRRGKPFKDMLAAVCIDTYRLHAKDHPPFTIGRLVSFVIAWSLLISTVATYVYPRRRSYGVFWLWQVMKSKISQQKDTLLDNSEGSRRLLGGSKTLVLHCNNSVTDAIARFVRDDCRRLLRACNLSDLVPIL